MAIRLIQAVGGKVQTLSHFARKNYFYPDLPKGYQISQYETPLGKGGDIKIEIDGSVKSVAIERIHLEEDAGKMIHAEGDVNQSLVDFNRCGVPLVEIVSRPELASPEETRIYLKSLRQILIYLGICSGSMQEGAFRCDANVSMTRPEADEVGVRTELKNLNSFRAVVKALTYELDRQQQILSTGGEISRATLLWDEISQKTILMRGKETSEDYRYFPDPDLVPLQTDPAWVENLRQTIPEMPADKIRRFQKQYSLSKYDASVLADRPDLADYFEKVVAGTGNKKLAANWVMVEVLRVLKAGRTGVNFRTEGAEMLAELLQNIESGVISGKAAKEIFEEMVATGKRAEAIVKERGLKQITDKEVIIPVVENVLEDQANQVELYKAGRSQLLEYFVGLVMKETKGKAKPQLVREILKERLDG